MELQSGNTTLAESVFNEWFAGAPNFEAFADLGPSSQRVADLRCRECGKRLRSHSNAGGHSFCSIFITLLLVFIGVVVGVGMYFPPSWLDTIAFMTFFETNTPLSPVPLSRPEKADVKIVSPPRPPKQVVVAYQDQTYTILGLSGLSVAVLLATFPFHSTSISNFAYLGSGVLGSIGGIVGVVYLLSFDRNSQDAAHLASMATTFFTLAGLIAASQAVAFKFPHIASFFQPVKSKTKKKKVAHELTAAESVALKQSNAVKKVLMASHDVPEGSMGIEYIGAPLIVAPQPFAQTFTHKPLRHVPRPDPLLIAKKHEKEVKQARDAMLNLLH